MNGLPITQISQNKFFSEDSYVMEDLFFLPKNLPLMDYHLKLLKVWNIEKVFSDGVLLDLQVVKSADEQNEGGGS